LVVVAAAGHIPARQRHRLAVVGRDRQSPLVWVEGGDLAAGAVHHPQLSPGVAAAHDSVTDPELPLTHLQSIPPEAAVLGHALARGYIQAGDLGPGEGDHPSLLAFPEPLPPVADLGGVGFRLAAADDHVAVLDQPVHRLLRAVVAEQSGDVLAELSALPVVAAQLGST
jgi:hypothetical protein